MSLFHVLKAEYWYIVFSDEMDSLAEELQLKLFKTSVKDNKYVEDGMLTIFIFKIASSIDTRLVAYQVNIILFAVFRHLADLYVEKINNEVQDDIPQTKITNTGETRTAMKKIHITSLFVQ